MLHVENPKKCCYRFSPIKRILQSFLSRWASLANIRQEKCSFPGTMHPSWAADRRTRWPGYSSFYSPLHFSVIYLSLNNFIEIKQHLLPLNTEMHINENHCKIEVYKVCHDVLKKNTKWNIKIQFPNRTWTLFIVHRCRASGSMHTFHAAGLGSIAGQDKFPGWGFLGGLPHL